MRKTSLKIAAVAVAFGLALTGCGGDKGGTPAADSKAKTATSAADVGGMEELIKLAKEEGSINVIALPDDWANYGEMKKAFSEKYGIKVNSILPDASSKEEIDAADKTKGTDKAPDVFDLGSAVALASIDHFAPYQVEVWDKIPAEHKESTGLWVHDYTGIMAVGYNATKFGEIKSLDELDDAKFKGQVALNGKPTEAGAAFNGFLMLNNANGGSFADFNPGIEYVTKLTKAGTFNLQDVTASTIDSGQHGVVFDWTYNQASTQERLGSKGVDWKVFVPEGGEIASFYVQAINSDAPHPAAARLWQEFLYSPEGQNIWLKGAARPVLFDVMEADGTLDTEAAAKLPSLSNDPKTPTAEEQDAANEFLKANWDKAVS